MLKRCLTRLAALAITLFIVSVMTFGAFSAVKGESALLSLGTQATEQMAENRRAMLGTDKSLSRQYLLWMAGLLHGDMGASFRYRQSVSTLILQALPVTLTIGGAAFLLALAAGIPLGAMAAFHKGAAGILLDCGTTVCLSVPEFFLSVIVIYVFSLGLHLFVPGGKGIAAIFFPSLVIAIPQTAILAKFVRAAVIAENGSLYVRTARCQGASPFRILACRTLPNALVSLVPLVAMIAANVFTGSVIVEQVFGIAGVGRLLVGAVLHRDLPLCRALVLLIAAATAVINFAADAVVQSLDTRVRV